MRKSSVYCHSQKGELVAISKREFQRRFINDDKTREYLLEHHQIKTQWKENRLEGGTHIHKSNANMTLSNFIKDPINTSTSVMNGSIDNLSETLQRKKGLTESIITRSTNKSITRILENDRKMHKNSKISVLKIELSTINAGIYDSFIGVGSSAIKNRNANYNSEPANLYGTQILSSEEHKTLLNLNGESKIITSSSLYEGPNTWYAGSRSLIGVSRSIVVDPNQTYAYLKGHNAIHGTLSSFNKTTSNVNKNEQNSINEDNSQLNSEKNLQSESIEALKPIKNDIDPFNNNQRDMKITDNHTISIQDDQGVQHIDNGIQQIMNENDKKDSILINHPHNTNMIGNSNHIFRVDHQYPINKEKSLNLLIKSQKKTPEIDKFLFSEGSPQIFAPPKLISRLSKNYSKTNYLNKTCKEEISEFYNELIPKQNANADLSNIKSHISSKSNIIQDMQEAFKPREVLKLKAFQKFEEIKENFNYFKEFKGKKKFEDFRKFEIPHKLKVKLLEVQNKKYEKHKYINNTSLYDFPNFPKKKKKHENETETTKIEVGKNEKEIKENKKNPIKPRIDVNLLPLKYIAKEIQQNYLFLPKIQGFNKHAKNHKNQIKANTAKSEIHDKILIEGNNLFFSEN